MVSGEDSAAVADRRKVCCRACGAVTLAPVAEDRIKNVGALYRKSSSADRWWLACNAASWKVRRGRVTPGSREGQRRRPTDASRTHGGTNVDADSISFAPCGRIF